MKMCPVFQPVVLQQPDRINSNTKILNRVFFSFINKWDQVFKSRMEGTNYPHKTYIPTLYCVTANRDKPKGHFTTKRAKVMQDSKAWRLKIVILADC